MTYLDGLDRKLLDLEHEGNLDQIVEMKQQIEDPNMYTVENNVILARALFDLGRFSETLEKIHEIYKKDNNNEARKHLLIIEIQTLGRLGKLDEARKLINETKGAFEDSPYLNCQFKHAIGLIQLLEGHYPVALEYFEDGLELTKLCEDSTFLISIKSLIFAQKSYANYFLGNFEEGISVGLHALELAIQSGSDLRKAHILIIIAHNNYELNRIKEAENLYLEAFEISKVTGFVFGYFIAGVSLAYLYKSLGKLDEASGYMNQILAQDEKYLNPRSLSEAYDTMGSILVSKGDLDPALEYFENSLEIRRKLNNNLELALSYQKVGKANYYLGNYNTSESYLEKSIELLDKTDNYNFISDGIFLLILVQLEIGNKKRAKHLVETLRILSKERPNEYISLQRRIAEGMYWKSSKRPVDRFKAYKIFEEIKNENVIDIDLSILSIFSLCELQIYELEFAGDTAVLEIVSNLKENIIELRNIAKTSDNKSVMIRVLLMQSKLELIDNPHKALDYVNQSEEFMNTNNLDNFTGIIELQRNLVVNEIEQWNKGETPKFKTKEQVNRLKMPEFAKLLTRQRDGVNMVLHEISNLLQVSMSYTNLLQLDNQISLESRSYLQSLEETGIQISGMIESLQEIDALENLQYKITYENRNIDEIVRNQISLHQLSAQKKNLTINYSSFDSSIIVPISSALTQRVISNLVSNAIKYATPDTFIDICTRIVKNSWIFSVSNAGPVISDTEKKLLFKRFFRLDRHKKVGIKGTGLGLAFCKQAVQAMNGRINLISPREGYIDGVYFEIILPLLNQN